MDMKAYTNALSSTEVSIPFYIFRTYGKSFKLQYLVPDTQFIIKSFLERINDIAMLYRRCCVYDRKLLTPLVTQKRKYMWLIRFSSVLDLSNIVTLQ